MQHSLPSTTNIAKLIVHLSFNNNSANSNVYKGNLDILVKETRPEYIIISNNKTSYLQGPLHLDILKSVANTFPVKTELDLLPLGRGNSALVIQ